MIDLKGFRKDKKIKSGGPCRYIECQAIIHFPGGKGVFARLNDIDLKKEVWKLKEELEEIKKKLYI